MAKESTVSMPTMAGRERAIPATKSFTTQLTVLYLLAVCLGQERGSLDASAARDRCAKARELASILEHWIPRWDAAILEFAARYARAQTLLYLGRSVHYAIAREGALKMKESSYVPAEGYPAGELQHGPNALVSEGVPLIVIATRDPEDEGSMLRYGKTLQLLRDLHLQGSQILVVASEGDEEIPELAGHTLFVPSTSEYLLPVLEVVPLQLLAHHCARVNGVDVDHPRNLVKAVLAE